MKLLSIILVLLCLNSMLNAMITETLPEAVDEKFRQIYKELGPAKLKALVMLKQEGVRISAGKDFIVGVRGYLPSSPCPDDGKDVIVRARGFLAYPKRIGVKQNYICLQDKDVWHLLNYDLQKEWHYKRGPKEVKHVVVDGDYLLLIGGSFYRVISLENQQEVYAGSIEGEIRACRAGIIVSIFQDTLYVYDMLTSTLQGRIPLANWDSTFMTDRDIGITATGTVVCREFRIKRYVDKGVGVDSPDYHTTTSYLGCFLLWDRGCIQIINRVPDFEPYEHNYYFEDELLFDFKLFIVDDKIITVSPRIGAITPKTKLMPINIRLIRVEAWNERGDLQLKFNFPHYFYDPLPDKAGFAFHGENMILCWKNAVRLCSPDGTIKSLAHPGAYVCLSHANNIISGSRDGTVRIWDSIGGDLLVTYSGINPLKNVIKKADFFTISDDGKQLVIGRPKIRGKYSVAVVPLSFIKDCNDMDESMALAIDKYLEQRNKKSKPGKHWKAIEKIMRKRKN